MSALSMRGPRRWRGLALPIVIVGAVAGMALAAGATTGDSADPSKPSHFRPRGAVTDAGVNPWGANDPALIAAANRSASVASVSGRRGEIEWSQSGVGAVITQADGSMLAVATIENSVDGPGAVVADMTLNGTSGTQKAKRYTANGVFAGEEEFALATPAADGTIPFTGSGECVKGGTRVHKNEKCSYTVSGTLEPATNVVVFEVTGTSTR